MGRESVWEYPRPPRLEGSTRRVRVLLAGTTLADSTRAYRVLETSHPPSWYIPAEDVRREFLERTRKASYCEWKGDATYWSVRLDGSAVEYAGWSYEKPSAPFSAIQGYFAFYPHLVECYVDEERVKPQPGGFYGGWITSDVVGPFKGVPGSRGW